MKYGNPSTLLNLIKEVYKMEKKVYIKCLASDIIYEVDSYPSYSGWVGATKEEYESQTEKRINKLIKGEWKKGLFPVIIGGEKEGERYLQQYIYGTNEKEKLLEILDEFKRSHKGKYWIEFQEGMF